MDSLAPCRHEEADTRLLIHALDAAANGHHRILIKNKDKDVVIIAISSAGLLQAHEI